MRILYVITALVIGGAERQVLDLAEQMAARGHLILIAYLTGLPEMLPKNPDIKVIHINVSKNPFIFAAGYFKLHRLIREFNPDIVHSHMVHANVLARLMRLTIRIPKLICTAHNSNEGGRLRMIAYRLTDPLADVFSNVSQEAVEVFEARGAAPHGRMVAIYNGIDIQRFSQNTLQRAAYRHLFSAGSQKIIIAIGRLTEQKDYPNLLNAFYKISNKTNNVKLWIVGDGPLRESLERMSRDLGLSERIIFLGIRQDFEIPNLICAADVFVLSSAWEGFGLVVAEAMAAEKIVVVTDSGGVKEVVGECGFLVPPKNSEALAKALEKALNMSSEQAKALGEKARQRIAENFSIQYAVDIWLKIYSDA